MSEQPVKMDPQRPEALAIAAAAGAFLLGGFGAALAAASRSLAVLPAVMAALAALAVALLGVARLRLLRRQAEEEAAVASFRAEHAGSELFADADEAFKAAARANRAYLVWFLPAAVILAGAALLTGAVLLWRHWTGMATPPDVATPLRYAVLSLSLGAGAVLAGAFFSGASRDPGCRWLRPAGSWFFLAGALFGLAAAAHMLVEFQAPLLHVDMRAGRIGLALVTVLGAEMLVNVIIEFYRPRAAGETERPLPESRLLTLVTEPGGIARNVAAALDYQFGFKVTDAWFYRFLERTVVPFAALAGVMFWLMSCIEVIQPEENGILMRFGRVVSRAPLQPGLHLKWPWPVDTIYLFPVERVQETPIGFVPAPAAGEGEPPGPEGDDVGDLTGRVMLWSKQHNKEEFNFVVASSPEGVGADAGAALNAAGVKVLPVNINFLSASIPLYFKVKDLYANQFLHRDGAATLQALANREVSLYLANVDFNSILARDRAKGGEELKRRIQAAVDDPRVNLGIEVVFVGLQGIHPPVKVGKEFDAVVGAMEQKHEQVLKAESASQTVVARAEGLVAEKNAVAAGYRNQRVQVARAEAARFEKQFLAYQASPELYVLYSYLDVMENEGRGVRKYVVGGDAARQVMVLNLEKKMRPDLLDLDVNDKGK